MGSEYPSGRKRRKGAILKKNGTNCRASGSNSAYSRMRAASAAEGRQLRSRTRAQASRGGAPPPHPPAGSLSVVGPRHDNWPLSSFNWPHFDVSSPQRPPFFVTFLAARVYRKNKVLGTVAGLCRVHRLLSEAQPKSQNLSFARTLLKTSKYRRARWCALILIYS